MPNVWRRGTGARRTVARRSDTVTCGALNAIRRGHSRAAGATGLRLAADILDPKGRGAGCQRSVVVGVRKAAAIKVGVEPGLAVANQALRSERPAPNAPRNALLIAVVTFSAQPATAHANHLRQAGPARCPRKKRLMYLATSIPGTECHGSG